MPSPNVPLINGNLYSFASVEIAVDGTNYAGITSIDYDDELKPGEARSNQAEIIGRTLGEHTSTASFEMMKSTWENVVMPALALAGTGPDPSVFGTTYFNVNVNYAEQFAPTVMDVIEACRVMKVTNSHKQGSEALTVKVELSVQRISHGGYYIAPRPNQVGVL